LFPIVVILDKFIPLIIGYTVEGYIISDMILLLFISFNGQFLFTPKIKITEHLQFTVNFVACYLKYWVFLLHASDFLRELSTAYNAGRDNFVGPCHHC
jgi:hypothetical protein